MARRLSFYFVLVAATALIAVIGYRMIGRWHTHHQFAVADWLQMAKIPVAVAAILVAARKLRANALSEPNKTLRARVVEGADALEIGFRRRPVLAVLLIALLLAIPFALVTLARGQSYGMWTRTDWTLLAVTEAPILLIPMVALVRLVKRSPNSRWSGP